MRSAEEWTEGCAAIHNEFAKVHQGNVWAVTRKVTLATKNEPPAQMLHPQDATIFSHGFSRQLRTLILVSDKSDDG